MREVLEILDRLIGFETLSKTSNAAMLDYVEGYCAGFGAKTRRVQGQTGQGLVAQFGPDAPGGVVLSGHCDVVPIDGQTWTRPAFHLTREGERLYGRGTTDMKGFLACMMAAGREASGRNLDRPLTLVFSYDEEIGCVGIQEMAAQLPPLLGGPRLCIVGEPTGMQIATGHKGKAALRAICRGQSGHSALAPHFVNALHVAADFIQGLRDLQDWFAEHGAQDGAYDVPYTTLHAGKMSGGTALNIVPDRAEITFEYRYLPGDGEEAVFSRIQMLATDIGIGFAPRDCEGVIELDRYNTYPGLEIDQSSDAARFVQALLPDKAFAKVAFGTEAGVFTGMGIPTLVCGPGSMAGQGHKPDEYIEVSQLASCASFLSRVVDTLQYPERP